MFRNNPATILAAIDEAESSVETNGASASLKIPRMHKLSMSNTIGANSPNPKLGDDRPLCGRSKRQPERKKNGTE